MTSAAVERRAWLFGPFPDLLFGCGLVYPLLVGVVAAVGFSREGVAAWVPLLILCSSGSSSHRAGSRWSAATARRSTRIWAASAQRGEQAEALEECRRSQALAPTPDAWPDMGVLYTRTWNALRERFN